MKTFNRLVVNTVIASTTSNFLWFALTFWVYLETRSVIASSVIGGSMAASNAASLAFFVLAGVVYLVAPEDSLPSL